MSLLVFFWKYFRDFRNRFRQHLLNLVNCPAKGGMFVPGVMKIQLRLYSSTGLRVIVVKPKLYSARFWSLQRLLRSYSDPQPVVRRRRFCSMSREPRSVRSVAPEV